MKKITLTFALIALIALGGCTSRHRLDLYLSSADFNRKVKIDQTHFHPKSVLSDPQNSEKVIPGDQNVIAATISTRWRMNKSSEFTFNENWKSVLYLQIPETKNNYKVDITKNSFVHLLEHYELDEGEKLFYPQLGNLIIDSLADKMMYLSINGEYKNSSNRTIKISGKFKVKAIE